LQFTTQEDMLWATVTLALAVGNYAATLAGGE
jgi:hypothetical protein